MTPTDTSDLVTGDIVDMAETKPCCDCGKLIYRKRRRRDYHRTGNSGRTLETRRTQARNFSSGYYSMTLPDDLIEMAARIPYEAKQGEGSWLRMSNDERHMRIAFARDVIAIVAPALVRGEREACARIAAGWGTQGHAQIATCIRARTQETAP